MFVAVLGVTESFKVEILSVSVRAEASLWIRANHLLLMSPWWRGHQAMYGQRNVQHDIVPRPHNVSCRLTLAL